MALKRWEKRKLLEQQTGLAAQKLKRRNLILIGLAIATVVACVALVTETLSRKKAPTSPVAQEKKSLEQLQKELSAKIEKEHTSKEYTWIKNGEITRALEEFKALKEGRDANRSNIIHFMGQLIRKPDPQALAGVDFLVSLLKDADVRGSSERLIAVQSLAEIGKAVPAYRKKAEQGLASFWANDTRAGPRGKVLFYFADLKSRPGFEIVTSAAKKVLSHGKAASVDNSITSSLLYSLSEYANDSQFTAPALHYIDAITRTTPTVQLKPLGVKLLALHKSPLAKAYIKPMSKAIQDLAAVDAAVYTIGKLRAVEYKDLLRQLLRTSPSSSLFSTFSQAFHELGMDDEFRANSGQ